jgi:hypothetical protein
VQACAPQLGEPQAVTPALPSFPEALAAYRDRRLPPAELACVYVAGRVREIGGPRWLQSARKIPLPCASASAAVRLFAERHLHKIPDVVPRALVAWADGRRPVDLWLTAPTPRNVLALQARGRRCVSLLEAAASDPLAFAVHDLCHLEKFVDPAHHAAQVGFFAAVDRAIDGRGWAALEQGLDDRWERDRDHVLADMNGAGVFLFVVLKNHLKLAVRRMVAAARGTPPSLLPAGPLDAAEASAFGERLDVLLDLLDLGEEAAAAARALSSRRDSAAAAATLEARFQALSGR